MRYAFVHRNEEKLPFESNSSGVSSVILHDTGIVFTMNVLLLATAFLALVAPPKAPVKVHIDAKNGDVITGESTFKVTVDSTNLVTQVEFYVNDDLRDKATSTPYRFTIDTLNEPEGPAKLRFKAYTSEGETGEATVNVKFYNAMDKGGDFHVQEGRKALQDGKYEKAVTEGRLALKIDSKLNDARLIVARGYLRLNVMDKAQKFAEDAVAADPKSEAALDMLAVINLKRGFTTFDRGAGDKNETLKTIGDAIKSAVENRQKALEARVDAVGTLSDTNLIAYVDAALRAGRYGLAITTLKPAVDKDNRRADLADRLAYAQIREGRYADAYQTLQTQKKYGTQDVYGQATTAVLLAEGGNAQASDDAIKDAILSDADNPIVTTAQAYIALKFVRTRVSNATTLSVNYDDLKGKDNPKAVEARNTLEQILKQLAKDSGQKTEVNYYLCALNNKLENYDTARKYFEQAVLTEPTNYDAYIEQGNKSFSISLRGTHEKDDLTFMYENARTMFNAALVARPSSAAALTGLSLVAIFEGKPDEAIKWGLAAVSAEPTYAAGNIALAAAYTLGASRLTSAAYNMRQQGNKLNTNAERQANELKTREIEVTAGKYTRQAREALNAATKIDKKIEGSQLTAPEPAWRYFNAGGRVPVLPMPTGS